jgi:hypothetical protein
MRFIPAVLALALLAQPAVEAAETSLGRLFFTPEQRAALEQARRNNIRAEELAAQAAVKPKAPRARKVVVNGLITRSDGMSVVWVNGKPVETETADGMRVSPTTSQGSVVLRDPQKGRALRLKVGQRADLLTGKVEENYESRRAAARAEEAARQAEATQPEPTAPQTRGKRKSMSEDSAAAEEQTRPDTVPQPESPGASPMPPATEGQAQ